MTTTSERYLQKQNERLANQNAVLMQAFENLTTENEVLGSIACAFAWDLSVSLTRTYGSFREQSAVEEVGENQMVLWDEAVKAVGG